MHPTPASHSKIAVVSPARNASQFYAGWLRTLEAQAYPKLEVILVDDGSDDRKSPASLYSLTRTAPPFLRYLRQDHRGPAAARNFALRDQAIRDLALRDLASGNSPADYFAFLDLDDLWEPAHLRRLAAALDRAPDAGIAQGLIRKFIAGEDGKLYYCSDPYRFVNLGAALFRREVFEQCGLFDESLRFGEDFDFIIRCWEQGVRKLEIPAVSLLYRRHDGNMTNGKNTVDLGAVQVYKRRLDRLRANLVDPAIVQARRVNFPDYLGRTVGPFDEGLREAVEF